MVVLANFAVQRYCFFPNPQAFFSFLFSFLIVFSQNCAFLFVFLAIFLFYFVILGSHEGQNFENHLHVTAIICNFATAF